MINSIKPTALNDAVKFKFKAVNSSKTYFPKCSKIEYDENQFIILDPHKAVKFNLKVVNLYREKIVLTFYSSSVHPQNYIHSRTARPRRIV